MPEPASLHTVRIFAARRHRFDRWGDQPYSNHLVRVEQVLDEFGYDSYRYAAGAWCHDLIEDTGTTRGEVEDLAGIEVADLVWAVTGIGPNRRARNADILRKLAVHPVAWPLKMADRIVNLERTVEDASQCYARMYLEDAQQFVRAVHGDYVTTQLYGRLLTAYVQIEPVAADDHRVA